MRHLISCDILQIRPVIGSNSGTEVESPPWKHILTSEVFNEIDQRWTLLNACDTTSHRYRTVEDRVETYVGRNYQVNLSAYQRCHGMHEWLSQLPHNTLQPYLVRNMRNKRSVMFSRALFEPQGIGVTADALAWMPWSCSRTISPHYFKAIIATTWDKYATKTLAFSAWQYLCHKSTPGLSTFVGRPTALGPYQPPQYIHSSLPVPQKYVA